MGASKAPSGLGISRSGTAFGCTWKRGAKYKYQQFGYSVNGGGWAIFDIDKNASAYTLWLAPSSVQFAVRGKKSGKSWSGWAYSDVLYMAIPPQPKVTVDKETPFSSKFKIEINSADGGAQQYTNSTWQTILVKDCNTEDGNAVKWDGAEEGTVTASFERSIDEGGFAEASYSYTRWFRVRSNGWVGSSPWAYAKQVYATPDKATNVSAKYEQLSDGGYSVSVAWDSPSSASKPIDNVAVQYLVAAPEVTTKVVDGTMTMSLSCPNVDTGWNSLNDVSGSSGKRAMSFTVPNDLKEDACVFVRVNNKHADVITYGTPVLAANGIGKIASPTLKSVTPGGIKNLYTVSVDRNSTISAAFIAVYLRTTSNPNMDSVIGIIPPNRDSVDCIIPDPGSDGISFGVKAFVANYSPVSPTSDSAPTYYIITDIDGVGKMESELNWDGGDVPLPPTNISLIKVNDSTVQIGWNWSWRDANQAELSWSDHDDAWESTNEPTTYIVNNTNASRWNIAGLDIGTWYFRIRLLKVVGESTVFGTYCETRSLKLSSSPDTPALVLSDGVISKTGSVTCYWAYVSTDGTAQMYAEVCEAFTAADGTITYGDPIGSTNTSQHITISAEEQGWNSGETHKLAVRVIAASGEPSRGWSAPVPVTIAEELHTQIVSHPFVEETETITGEGGSETRKYWSLKELPLTVKATGAGVGGTTTYIIERADAYYMDRPDGSEHEGFKGETVAIKIQNGEDAITITQEDLLGYFDDGASYRLIAIAKDTYGQTAEATLEFEVHWTHQAIIPEATVSIDRDNNVTFITPIKPAGWADGDVADIYRLSADTPELIVKGAEFGTKYVDPYPAFGDFGGIRIVYRTFNGDYITDDDVIAWTDFEASEDGQFKHDRFGIIIDFNGEQLVLPYNVSFSNSWTKDFTKTKYLGGSIQGDWNPGIEKDLSATTTIPVEIEPEQIEAVRRLAIYPGICHVRMPDGSSFTANVDVKDDREEKWTRRISRVSLTINKIDAEGFDGVTYEQWTRDREDEE